MPSAPPTEVTPFLPFRGVENDGSHFLPLNPEKHEIRYIRLESGRENEPLICHLGHTTLDKTWPCPTPYEALSYCWGEITDVVNISMYFPATLGDDLNATTYSEQRYRITHNLETALYALRLPHESRILWIDALCINQSDDKEKTAQVTAMNLIYSGAKMVLVWLGEADSYSNAFMQYCRFVKETRDDEDIDEVFWEKCLQRLYSDELFKDVQCKVEADPSSTGSEEYDVWFSQMSPAYRFAAYVGQSFVNLVSRSWFKRVWVYQETLLAPSDSHGNRQVSIIVGPEAASWTIFYQAVRRLQFIAHGHQFFESNDPITLILKPLIWFRETWIYPHIQGVDFVSSFRNTLTFLASDPRDKIFALLHIASDTKDRVASTPLLRPNYGKNIQQIVMDFSRCGIHLPLVMKTATLLNDRLHDGSDILRASYSHLDFAFTFWNSQFWNVIPFDIDGRAYNATHTALKGKVRSSIVRRCELIYDWTVEDCRSWSAGCAPCNSNMSDTFVEILATFRHHASTRTDDATLWKNILDMLDISTNNNLEKACWTTAWDRMEAHGGFIGSVASSVDDLDIARDRSGSRATVFLDSIGRLLVSHSRTQVGDLIIEVADCASSFIVSPPDEHLPAVFTRQLSDISPIISPTGQPSPGMEHSYLFLGVCSIYPGETKYQVPDEERRMEAGTEN